ncbi:2OG-Fe(II) oxygenase [Emcibacter nanhaiensis]|uniref:2OG-Fe(II) oxygenase n=1 Tax=Emcibacter nanhaiensis TaxID=1505037 RepID=A0A501PKC3_9PROT|nr:2OG-Fe(II) oxygenase [Emcibacter nanhaiensis]TPD60166.1 2OG-Fe(II) oxygenase [Emcibacter nanhaiensis]
MSNLLSDQVGPGMITGERIPNFARLDTSGSARLFYDLCCGQGALILLAPAGWQDGEVMAECRARAEQQGLVPILLSVSPGTQGQDGWIVLVDTDGALIRHFTGLDTAAGLEKPEMILTDSTLRVAWRGTGPLPALADRSNVVPPVLQVPGLFSPDECRSLISYFQQGSAELSGSHGAAGDGVALEYRPDLKRRRDVHVHDSTLTERLMMLISRRLGPELRQVYHFTPSQVEKFKLACYSNEDEGHFAVHRDNSTPDARQRKFALTVNLNTGDYEGGGLVFPEYSSTPVVPPRGGAVVFSCGLAHRVLPVTRGQRYVLISFFS